MTDHLSAALRARIKQCWQGRALASARE